MDISSWYYDHQLDCCTNVNDTGFSLVSIFISRSWAVHYIDILSIKEKMVSVKFKNISTQSLFEVQLNWLNTSKGILTSKDVDGFIHVAAATQFDNHEKSWSPEHLFLSAINSCFMITYLRFAKEIEFAISHFECNTIGQIQMVTDKYKFTHINLYPKIYIAEESIKEKANLALQKTHASCLISSSVNAEIFYHSEILIDEHPRYTY